MAIKGYKKNVVASPEVHDLKRLIDLWREKELVNVRSCDVVPDASNRMHTGLSVDHVHFLATKMMMEGFRGRERGPVPRDDKQPHDIPVLVRGSPNSTPAQDSLVAWRASVAHQPKFPPVVIPADAVEWFCSLGNGHFTQALNCFRNKTASIFTGEQFLANPDDPALMTALNNGVESIVLREDTPIEVRREVSFLLNATHDYKWTVDYDGNMDISSESSALHRFTNFEALSKSLDNEALTQLVRLELGMAKEMDDREDAEREKKKHLSRL